MRIGSIIHSFIHSDRVSQVLVVRCVRCSVSLDSTLTMSYGEYFDLKTTFRNTETKKGTGLKKARKENKKSKAICLAKVAMKKKKLTKKLFRKS